MKPNPYPGKFIAFEGIDGCGKSSQAILLFEALKKDGYNVLLTKEPTDDGIFGKLVRAIYICQSLAEELPEMIDSCLAGRDYELIKAMMDAAKKRHIDDFENIAKEIKSGNHEKLPLLLQMGMIFDRYDHRMRVEIPALKSGINVFTDRDFPSTLAYGASEGLSRQELQRIQLEVLGENFIVPDLFIFLDVSAEAALDRTLTKQSGKREYFDNYDRLVRIQSAYHDIFEKMPELKSRVKKIDAEADIQTIHKKILEFVKPMMMGS